MGPGTDVIERLKRGDQGKTFMDNAAQLHDIEYMLASGESTTAEEAMARGRKADIRMVQYGKRARKKQKDHWFNITQGAGLIQAKMFLEDWGVIRRDRFIGKHSARYLKGAQDRDITEGEFLHRKRQEILSRGHLADLTAYGEEYGFHLTDHGPDLRKGFELRRIMESMNVTDAL